MRFAVVVLPLIVVGSGVVALGVWKKLVPSPVEPVAEVVTAKPSAPSPQAEPPTVVPTEISAPQAPSTPTHYEANLQVTAVPSDSLIILTHDGQTSNFTGAATFKGLLVKPETFLVSAKREGYSAAQQEITLTPENRSHKSEMVLNPLRFGTLSVAARPWGKVYLKDLVSGAETPFVTEKVPVGEHAVSVLFPPTSRKVSAEVTIREGEVARCQAVFGSNPILRCE